MRGIKYLAAFGTIFFFIGFYCLRAAFQKNTSTHSSDNMKGSAKAILVIAGIVFIALGIYLIIRAILSI